MNIRHLVLSLGMVAVALTATAQEDTGGKYFPYPAVPDENMSLSQRCNYLAMHHWDKCNPGSAFSDRRRMTEAFRDWTLYLPYTTIDTAVMAVERTLERFPKNTLDLTKLAETYLYGDSGEFVLEEVYLPFVRAVVKAKKVPGAEKARYEAQLKVLESSMVGQRLPRIEARARDGSKTAIDSVVGSSASVLLFVNDPECDDCRLARSRLAADYNTGQLVEKGLLRVISAYPGEYSDEWTQETATYPKEWEVVAAGDLDQYIDLRKQPTIYFLDKDMKVLLKNAEIDYILDVFRTYVTQYAK